MAKKGSKPAYCKNPSKYKNMEIKQRDIKFEEAALLKRLEFVRNLKDALLQEDSIATVTVDAYSSLIDGKLLEMPQLLLFVFII